MPDAGTVSWPLVRRSEPPKNGLNSSPTATALPLTPEGGEAKTRLLQDFPGGRPAYELADGDCDTPCWLWLGATHRKGYPSRCVNGRRVRVHRELVGAAPGEEAHHLCGNVRCVNPEHIQALASDDHTRLHYGRLALDDALELLAVYPRLSPSAIARLSGRTRSAVQMALHRAHRSGRVRRVGVGEYVLAEPLT